MLLPEPGYGELDVLNMPLVVDRHINYAATTPVMPPAWFGLPSTLRTGMGCKRR
jgi:hypothetical protein